MNLSDVYPPKGHVQTLVCESCGGPLDLEFGDFHEDVSGIDITVTGLPYLHCPKCGADHLPDH